MFEAAFGFTCFLFTATCRTEAYFLVQCYLSVQWFEIETNVLTAVERWFMLVLGLFSI